jgi:hypothetical protein
VGFRADCSQHLVQAFHLLHPRQLSSSNHATHLAHSLSSKLGHVSYSTRRSSCQTWLLLLLLLLLLLI